MSQTVTQKKTGGALGLDIRSGKVAKTGSTKRIQELNGLLHATRPSIDIQRARAFTKVYRETEGEPELLRRYKASAEMYRSFKPVIYDHERLAGWAAGKIRAPRYASTPTRIGSATIWTRWRPACTTRSSCLTNIRKS